MRNYTIHSSFVVHEVNSLSHTSRGEKDECIFVLDQQAVNDLLLRQAEIVKTENAFEDFVRFLHARIRERLV